MFEIGSQEHREWLRTQDELAIAIERLHAEKIGVVEEFDRYVSEGRFREYMPRLNYMKLQEDVKHQNKAYFVLGLIVGIVVSAAYGALS